MKTISFINLKGGVAKTVTTANIGWLLAIEHKKSVLLIDMDAQGHLSRFWGVRSSAKPSVADLPFRKEFAMSSRRRTFPAMRM